MIGFRVCLITILLTALYLLISVGTTTIFINHKSNGSTITTDEKIVGSTLIGQRFNNKIYFHSRPSANNYRNDFSGNSNLAYKSNEIKEYTEKTKLEFNQRNQNNAQDLNIISESASGLDPHITTEGALAQVKRVSKNSMLTEEQIKTLISNNSKPRIAGIFGEKIVNVLELNLDVNKLSTENAKKTRTRWNLKADSKTIYW